MKYLKTEQFLGDADCAEDAVKSSQLLESRLSDAEQALAGLGTDADPLERARLLLEAGYVLIDLDRKAEAWSHGREALDLAVPAQGWTEAVEACDIIYQADQEDSIKALAHGVWLGVTYPVDPELSVAMLDHLIDETPPKSDGTAVAAAAAHFIVDVRAEGKQRDDLQFFTTQLLGTVARNHSEVDEQDVFEFWVERLALNDAEKVLSRLGRILDVLVTDGWWFDRDALRAQIQD